MTIEIYYFSGTGNSLYVAKKLQKKVPHAKLIPIVNRVNKDIVKSNAETIGFVFPIYFLTIPMPVSKFLEVFELDTAKYIFAIATRGGSKSHAFEEINKILKKKDKILNSQIDINMNLNLPIWNTFHEPTSDEISQWDSEIENKLDILSRNIIAKENYNVEDKDIKIKLPLWKRIFLMPFRSFFTKRLFVLYQKMDFYNDFKCNGCGICEKVCLSNKIKVIEKKPIWQKSIKCYSCFACINFCPNQSIQIRSKFPYKSHTEINGRYHHPSITYKDIETQKNL